LAQDGGEWPASSPGRFNSREQPPVPIKLEGGQVGYTACLDALEKWETTFPCHKSNHDSSNIQPRSLFTISTTLFLLQICQSRLYW